MQNENCYLVRMGGEGGRGRVWGKINVKLGINTAIWLHIRNCIFGQFKRFSSLFFLFGTFFGAKFGRIKNWVRTRQIWGNWLRAWPRISHAGDSWPTYIASITLDKYSNAPKYSKENGLNKSVTSSTKRILTRETWYFLRTVYRF